jgi:hypothetical protein
MWRFPGALLVTIALLASLVLPSHAAKRLNLSRMVLRVSDLPKGFSLTSALDLKNQPGGAEEYIAGFAPKQTGSSNSCMGMMCSSGHPGTGLTQVESDITLYLSVTAAQHAIPRHAAPAKPKLTPVGEQDSVQYSSDAAAGTTTIVLLFREGRVVASIQVTGYTSAGPNQIGYIAHDLNHFAAIVDGRIKQAGAVST